MKKLSRHLLAALAAISLIAASTSHSKSRSMGAGVSASIPTPPAQPHYEVTAGDGDDDRPAHAANRDRTDLGLPKGIPNTKGGDQESDRISEYNRLLVQWRAGDDYRATALGLLEYRSRYGGTPDVDFMIASSFCRVPGEEQAGYDRFREMLREYRLDEPSRRLIQEQLQARPESRRKIVFRRQGRGWVASASVRGQLTRFQPTAFVSAVSTGKLRDVRAFFGDGNSGDETDSVPSADELSGALSGAARRDDDEGIKVLAFLLDRGADAKGRQGYLALQEAILYGKVGAVRLLLEHGTTPEVAGDSEELLEDIDDVDGQPLLLAATKRDREGVAIAKLLYEKGGRVNTVSFPHHDAPLLAAAREGTPAMVKFLLESRADVKVRYGTDSILKVQEFDAGVVGKMKVFEGSERMYEVGSTPLIFASGRAGSEGSDIVKLLLKHGASTEGLDGAKALLRAAAAGNVETLRLLIGSGVSVNARNEAGTTALMVAAEYGATEVVEFLLGKKADRLLKNDMNNTAFDVASAHGYADITSMLK